MPTLPGTESSLAAPAPSTFGVPSPDPATVPPAFRELQAAMELYSREMVGQGASAVLIEAKVGGQAWSHTAGTRTLGGAAAAPGDPVFIGAVGRSMLAVLVLALVEEGLVVLDLPVATYLPELSGTVAGGRSVREVLGRKPSALDPSDQGYRILGVLVERLRGAGLATVLARDIGEPLGLRSFPVSAGANPDTLVHRYVLVDGDASDVTAFAGPGEGEPRIAAGVADLNSFYAGLLEGRLLEPASLVEMKGPLPGGYGLGLDQWDDRCTNGSYFGHAADLPGGGVVSMSSADGNRQLTLAVSYPPAAQGTQPSALTLELMGLAQVALNSGCRFQFR
ncbi:serine hydrolase [Paenarthrobacter sp. NCHU4564]|uniref:serine hydrolase n=1 Tax=Paenarthrobacter sp. NCHU4564 TaxID=3451353 RepID=UPI003F98CF67